MYFRDTSFFMLRHFKTLFFVLFYSTILLGKGLSVEEMRAKLKTETDEKKNIEYLYKIGWKLRNKSTDSTLYYGTLAFKRATDINYALGQIKALTTIGTAYKLEGKYDDALDVFNQGLKIARKNNLEISIAKLYNNIGIVYKYQGLNDLAAEFYERSIEIKRRGEKNAELANSINNLAIIHKRREHYDQALHLNLEALEIREALRDTEKIATSLTNIGMLYSNKRAFDLAKEYYDKALNFQEQINHTFGKAVTYNNLGLMYNNMNDHENAVLYYQKSIDIYESIGRKDKTALAYVNIGESYIGSKPELALTFLNKAEKIAGEIDHKPLRLQVTYAIGNNYQIQNRYLEAVDYYNQMISLAVELSLDGDRAAAYLEASKCYSKLGKTLLAYRYLLKHAEISKFMHDAESKQNAKRMEAIYQKGKLEKEVAELNTEQELAERKQFFQWIVFAIALVSALFISIAVWRSMKLKRLHLQVVEAQKEQVENQRDLIAVKNEEITSSIEYAKKIQNAVLTKTERLDSFFSNYFILFEPKDIVSGDFYWAQKRENKIYFSAADCTGHGVPGAMVSVICINTLTKVVQELGITEPAKILDETSALLEKNFDQADEEEGIADGMDLSLSSFDTSTKVLSFAGANNPLYIVKAKDSALYASMPEEPVLETDEYGLFEMKADSQPIGKYFAREPFKNHEIQMESGDVIYSFTDGFADQFGGPRGKKFKYKPFKRLLLSIQNKSMDEQHNTLLAEFRDWQGDEEQVDDVCIMGVKVK